MTLSDDTESTASTLIDEPLRDAVTQHLREFMARRSDEASGLDAAFTDEVLGRLTAFVLGGGKRTRPIFAWWGWRSAGGSESGVEATAALRAASALELIQAFALIQDDVMDRSALRRGRPALHREFTTDHEMGAWLGDPRRYGSNIAVLTADLALVWAEDLFADALAQCPDARERARVPWRGMLTEMVVGQFMDLNSQARGDEAASTPVRVNQLKTAAYSVERPLHLGASLAGASDQVTSGLRTYGTAIGCAYQLRDDLLDLYGDPERTGKPRGGDLREGKRPLILALGLRSARERGGPAAVATLRAAIGEPGLTDVDVRVVADLLVELGAKDAVERRLYSLIQEAKRSLATTPIAASARQELSRLAHLAGTRTR